MRLLYLAIVFLSIPLLVSGQGRSSEFVMDRGDLVEDLLFQYYEEYGFNGSLLVAENNIIIYENTFGFADFEAKVPLDNTTSFYLASLGKQFTATAIMKLLEEGRLSLNDPIIEYFPYLPKTFTEVKISNLLNHTSGIPDYLNSSIVKAGMSNQDVYKYLLGLKKLDFSPGDKYKYSNTGYALLAMVIGSITGQSVQQYFETEFFEPLQMNNSFIYTRNSLDENRALGYDENKKLNDYNLFTVGDGGFYSTSADIFKWIMAINNGDIISEASLTQMYTPVRLSSGREKRYGFGWEIGSNTSGPLVYHTGQLAGFRTYLERQNSTGTTIIVLTNNSFSKMGDLRNKLVKILDGRMTSLSDN